MSPVQEHDAGTLDLPSLAAEIVREHEAAATAARSALGHARRAGELLVEARRQVGHGGWTTWVKDNFPASARTARLYMQVARRWPELEASENGNALPIREAARLLAAPKVSRGVRVSAQWTMELSAMRRRAEQQDATAEDAAEHVIGSDPDTDTEQSATVEIVNGIDVEDSTTLPWPGAKSRRRPATQARALQLGLAQIAGTCMGIENAIDVPTATGLIEPEQRAGLADALRDNIALLQRVLAELVAGVETAS